MRVVIGHKVDVAADCGMGRRSTNFLHRTLLPRGGLDHIRPADKHICTVFDHDQKICERGGIGGTSRARTRNHRNLRHNTRQKDILEMRDFNEEDPAETEAGEYGLSYVKLDGNVGCMVNGAGLAMSTMDIIKYKGGEPANFLDVGGGASPETVAKGMEIILRDKNVKVIFINIFGGIVRCDRIANGIIEATKKVSVNVPVVVRLDGTNAEIAKDILDKSGIEQLVTASDLNDGAEKAVNLVKA